MATKSFTTDMTFNRKNAPALITALERKKEPQLTHVNSKTLRGKEEVLSFVNLLRTQK